MKRNLFALALFLTLCIPSAGTAAVVYDGHFGDMDSNGDALITWEEFQSFFHDADKSVFDGVAGDDGAIDHDEWHRFKKSSGYTHDSKGHKE